MVIASTLSVAASLGSDVDRREIGSLVIEGMPEIPQRIVDRMFQYQSTRSAFIQDWEPAGNGMLISTRFAETSQFHFVEKPSGARHQITFFPEPVSEAAMRPDPSVREFIFTMDVGGGEDYQIYRFDMKDGDYAMLTDGASKNGSLIWSNRGDRFAYYHIEPGAPDWEIYLGDAGTPAMGRPLLREKGSWEPVDWSPDDRQLLISKYVSASESFYYTLDIETGDLIRIHPVEEAISYGDAVWSGDGQGVFLTSDEGDEFHRLRHYDLGSGRLTLLSAGIPWDVADIEISKSGDRLAFTTNEDGISRLYLLDTGSQRYEQVEGIPHGRIYGLKFHPEGDRLAMVLNTPKTPGDIYVLSLSDAALERWTYSEVGGLNPEAFVEPALIHYETFDTADGKPRMTPAFYYKPMEGEGPFPVLIDIHGGPEAQYAPSFSSSIQYYVKELGVALLAPNVRGSSGYGKSYLKLDDGYRREDSVRDIGKLLDWIGQQPELDASRVAVIGGSYGGYMVLASMAHFNDRLRCGIDIVGISNFVTFLENTSEYRRDLRRVEYGDERDPQMREFLARISPTSDAHRISRPMFIVQGLNDPRVPAEEAEQIVSAIRKNGGTAWYLLARDEGHGFQKKANRDFYQHAVALFLEEYLLK